MAGGRGGFFGDPNKNPRLVYLRYMTFSIPLLALSSWFLYKRYTNGTPEEMLMRAGINVDQRRL